MFWSRLIENAKHRVLGFIQGATNSTLGSEGVIRQNTMTIHIAFEGIDNSGKTTLCASLDNHFKSLGKNSMVSKEFSSSYGTFLKQRLYGNAATPNEKLLAFALDRLVRYDSMQCSGLDYVIWDRYTFSSIVYRGIEGIDEPTCREINKSIPPPNFYFYLDVTPDESERRGKCAGKSCPYDQDFLSKCRGYYLEIVQKGDLICIQGKTTVQATEEVINHINMHP